MPPARSSARRHIAPWLLRVPILAAWLIATTLSIDLPAIIDPQPGQGPAAALHTLAAIALALAAVFIILARHRLELGWPTLILGAAVALQAGAAALAATLTPLIPVTPPAPGLALGPVAPALITAICFGLILLHASWVLTPVESSAPLRARLRAWLRTVGFNPITLLFGPVFQKEVRVAGRRRGTYVARTLYPLVLLGIVALAYLLMTDGLGSVSGAERLQRLQDLAPQLALVIAWCQFAILSFIAPVMTAPAICDERRQQTLSALMTTPMTSSQIIFGKLTSRLVLVLILALVSTPLLLAVRIYGGLEAEIIVATTAISTTAAVLGASLGLLYSVWHRRAATAAVFGLLTMFLLMLLVVVAVIVIGLRSNLPPGGWVFGLSAPMAMVGVTIALVEPFPGVDGMGFLREVWITSVAVNLTLSALVCSAATIILRGVLRAEAAGALSSFALDVAERPRRRRRRAAAGPIAPTPNAPSSDAPESDVPASIPPVSGAQPLPAEDASPEPTRTGATRTVGDNPILWREIRQASFGSRRRLAIIAIAVLAGAGFIYSRVPFSDEGLHFAIGMIGIFVIILQAAMVSTGAIAGEFESRTWPILLTTPLTGSEIVRGKFLGALRRQWFILACLAAHFLLGVASGYVHPIAVVHLAMIALACAVMLTGTGILLSLLLRRSSAAGVCNILLALGLWLIVPFGTILFLQFTDRFRGDSSDLYITAFLVINPFAMTVTALEPMIDGAGRLGAALPYDLPTGRIGVLTFTAILAATTALGVAIGLASTYAATKLFRRVGGRTS